MKSFALVTFATALSIFLPHPASAEPFREGVVATISKQGNEVVAFAFVICDERLMFDFTKDENLNDIKLRNDGGLEVKFNNNKSQLTFYDNGRMKNKKGEVRTWRYLQDAEMIGPLAKRLTKAKEKCG